MKQVLFVLLLMSSVMGYSQTINPPSPVVGNGFGILKGTTITVDSLNFDDGWVLLMQDNSTLIVNESLNGNGVIRYGDVGDDIPKFSITTRKKIRRAVEEKLTTEPEFFGKPLRKSLKGFRKLRVGDYRIVFRIESKKVKIFYIGHRSIVYQKAEKRKVSAHC